MNASPLRSRMTAPSASTQIFGSWWSDGWYNG